jgi:diguanylate cyclase (GGDEF)-like protein
MAGIALHSAFRADREGWMAHTGPQIPADSLAARALQRGFGRLRFEPPLEREFWASHNAASQARVRLAVFLALATTLSFALLDHWLLGQPWQLPQDLIRFGLQVPIILLCLALTTEKRYERAYVPAIKIGAPLFGIGSVIMATGAPEAQVALLSTRLVLAAFFFYFMLGLSFHAALRANIVMLAAYPVAAWANSLPPSIAVYCLFVLACANLFAGAGSYALEHANRVAFLERKLLAEVASHDGLTGLLNRAAFDAEMRRIWDGAARTREPVAVLMLDIDHFKAYNDRYGHPAGDQCLREVAAACRQAARRPRDAVARYGGEELIAVLPGADRTHALATGRAIVDAVSVLCLPHAASPIAAHVTVSVGVAVREAGEETSAEALIRSADDALYAAKAQGRNRCVLYAAREPRVAAAS